MSYLIEKGQLSTYHRISIFVLPGETVDATPSISPSQSATRSEQQLLKQTFIFRA